MTATASDFETLENHHKVLQKEIKILKEIEQCRNQVREKDVALRIAVQMFLHKTALANNVEVEVNKFRTEVRVLLHEAETADHALSKITDSLFQELKLCQRP